MNLNVLKPRQAVESAFASPNVAIALVLVLVASVIAIAAPLALGIQADLVGSAPLVLLSSYIRFFALAVILYIAAYILKGRDSASGKFSGILSALGLLQIPIIASMLVSIVMIPMVLPPFALELAADLQAGTIAAEDVPAWVGFLYDLNKETVNISALYALVGFILLIGLFNLYLLYRVASKLFQYRALPNIVLMVVILIINGFIFGFLPI